jgi:hypothetical protein
VKVFDFSSRQFGQVEDAMILKAKAELHKNEIGIVTEKSQGVIS